MLQKLGIIYRTILVLTLHAAEVYTCLDPLVLSQQSGSGGDVFGDGAAAASSMEEPD